VDLLDSLHDPLDLRKIPPARLGDLAAEIRAFLIDAVCRSGGHLGPNLGVVELTIALHRVFQSPETPIIFDTGHQAYVHKILTGRRDGMAKLRVTGGLSGYPNRRESVHDVVENSHASTALSYADGMAAAFALSGRSSPVVALVGDGSLTGGLALEALNNIGAQRRNVILVLNDNGRSYSPTAGGLVRHLARIVDRGGYRAVAERLAGDGHPGSRLDGHPDGDGSPAGPGSSADATSGVFGSLGFGYLGPVDGHDISAVEAALRRAAGMGGPVVVHCRTSKGRGYLPAEADGADHMHTVGSIDPATGTPVKPAAATWTDAFADALVAIGSRRPDVVGVSAAMLGPTGLQRFADRFPGRCFDVGIAEAHAVTSAAGMAMAGQHPVVALYATFAGRAFDEELMDVGLHQLPVTLVLDRAGITGPDGPSHHGMWDLAMLGIVPGIRVAAPRDAATLVEELDEAVGTASGPTALRFPKASLGAPVPAIARVGSVDVLRAPPAAEVLVVGTGALCSAALAAADLLESEGIVCTVVDPRWVLPAAPELADLAARHRLVVTVEDGLRIGGVGSHVAALLSDRQVPVPVRALGLPGEFIGQGSRAELLSRYGLDAEGIAASIRAGVGAQPRTRISTEDPAGQLPAQAEHRAEVFALRRSVG
jgi:1-deoxy-D-xylulose-5-phosphate synthase